MNLCNILRLFICLGTFTVQAQSDTIPVIRLDSLSAEGILLDKGWLFQAGDSGDWAKLNFYDKSWQPINPALDIHHLPQVRKAGIGWFRLHLRINRTLLGKPLALIVRQIGASEVYLNGQLIQRFGQVSREPKLEHTYNPNDKPYHIQFIGRSDQVLAIRYSFGPQNLYVYNYNHALGNPCFRLRVNQLNEAIGSFILLNQVASLVYLSFFSIYFILGLLHLLFFQSYHDQRANLFVSVFALLHSCVFLLMYIMFHQHQASTVFTISLIANTLLLVSLIFLLLSVYTILHQPTRIVYKLLILYALLGTPLLLSWYDWGWLIGSFGFFLAYSFDIVRISFLALRRKQSGAWGFIWNFSAYFILFSLYIFFTVFFSVPSKGMNQSPGVLIVMSICFILGQLCIPLGISKYLSYEFGLVNRSLKQRLSEVETLSRQTLMQELERKQLLAEQNETLERQVEERTAELRATQAQLLQFEKSESGRLRELDTMKSRFFANLSHEFRTPLSLISGTIQQLKPSSEQTSGFAIIQRYSHRLLQLINQLLDLSKLEAGQLQPHPQVADVTGLLRALASSFESLADSRGINYRYALPLQPQWANLDADKLEKILTNLLGNALKFTPAGGQVVFSASLEEVTSSNCLLRLNVEDTGIGISSEQLPHIFDRFYQVDTSATRAYEGSGIGLALTKELVELLSGSIRVKSQVANATPHSGTTFTVHLPLTLTAEPTELSSASAQESPAEDYLETTHQQFAQLSRHAERVLVVEDNADLRHFISKCLANRYSVLQAADGQQGLRQALETIPDLVISDVMMPGLDGMSLCQRLKSDERTSHIPVILLTAKTDSKLQGLQLGADDHLSKPFQVEELRVRVDNLIAQRKRLREKFARQVVMQPKAVEVTSLDDQFLQKVLTVMEAQLSNAGFDVEGFSREMGMSRAQLQRKLTALTGQGPNELMRRFRLERAADLLRHRQGNVGEVALSVGFSNLNYFTRCFREHFGKTPSEYLHEVAGKDAL